MKKYAFLSIAALFIIVLSACGSSDSEGGEDTSSSEGGSLLEQIKEEGVLTVGTEGTYAPYTFHDDNDELTGYDVEVAKEIGERMDVEVEFEETKWDSMFAGLNSERFDMIANQVGIQPDREEKYSFSEPYTYTSAVLVAKSDNEEIKSFDDLEGASSAQSLTSNYADIAKQYGAEIESVEGFTPAMELLNNDRVDATVNDRLSVLDYLNQKDGNSQVEIVDQEDDASETAMMFRQDNPELVEAVNDALEEMREDGTLEEISNEWFDEDVSVQ
ncbi:amino acid ABC transporter substrate-binding protein [Halobacillus sp. A1]|uniref:amino acid ABC transporter substrate-binding protein n=1 Tax=Halobacillus sp. A1 TaxID=2880262 RepID=UPI0020A6A249|nr:amino acid ABC transporter substrate-binding protein [Halobacillus sp. A1]MCP3030093.1 amino acid ABC transporter substrate-binding protein [Halobacillus sp. A1]